MKTLYLLSLISAFAITAIAQDEGSIEVKSRFGRSKSLSISAGPAFTLGKNLGDYSTGIMLEAGFAKRMNKIFSVGPTLSLLQFRYDTKKTYPYYYSAFDNRTIVFSMEGGDITLLSLGLNCKLNFIPVSDHTTLSVYGIANPFVSRGQRKSFTGTGDFYADNNGDGMYSDFLGSVSFGADEVAEFKQQSKLTGGLILGVGTEFTPAKMLSFFGEISISYTLPISYAATESFLKPEDKFTDSAGTVYYNADNTVFDESFPIVKNGFSALNITAGVSFNF